MRPAPPIIVSHEQGLVVVRIGGFSLHMCPKKAMEVASSIAHISSAALAAAEEHARLAKEIAATALHDAVRARDDAEDE